MGMLRTLIKEARACRVCAPHLPLGPRPVFLVGKGARLMIVGQAPGRRVHDTGIPWNDPSGERLRAWLQMDRARFYDTRHIAIVPTGLCYPGTGARGDLPPRPECAPLWQPRFRAALPGIRLTLLVVAERQHWRCALHSSQATESASTYRALHQTRRGRCRGYPGDPEVDRM